MTLLLVLQLLIGPAHWLTPGEVQPVTSAQVCAAPWQSDLGVAVDQTMWRRVLTAYGIRWEDRYQYTPDPLIPRSLGGTVSAKNVRPLPKDSEWNQGRKDDLGHALYDLVCTGQTRYRFTMPPMPLREAQMHLLQWVSAWDAYVRHTP